MKVSDELLPARVREARRPVWGALLCALLGVVLWPAAVGMDLPLSSWTLRLASAVCMLLALLLALQDLKQHAGNLRPVLLALVVALLFPVLAWREINLQPVTMGAWNVLHLASNARIELTQSYQSAGQMPSCSHPTVSQLLANMNATGDVASIRCERPVADELRLTLGLQGHPDAPTLVLRYQGGQEVALDCTLGTLAQELRPAQCQG